MIKTIKNYNFIGQFKMIVRAGFITRKQLAYLIIKLIKNKKKN